MKSTKFSELIKIFEILQNEGFDVKHIKVSAQNGKGNSVYTRLRDINQEGLDIQSVISKYNLDGNYPFGRRKSEFVQACKGSKYYHVSEKEMQEGRKFVVLSPYEKVLDILELLKAEGIRVNEIKLNKIQDGKEVYNTLGDINQGNINEIIEKYNLNPNYKIGCEITKLRQGFNEKGDSIPLSKDEARRAIALGAVFPNKESVITRAIRILGILEENGVDINEIPQKKGKQYTTLKEINQNGIDIDSIISNNCLDGDYRIGEALVILKKVISTKTTYAITDEQLELAENMLENKVLKNSSELFYILNTLKAEGVDISRINLHKKVGNRSISTVLKDINQDGINISEIIERYDLNENYRIGSKIGYAKERYNSNHMSKDERKNADKLGIFGKRKPSMVELLDTLELLQKEGIELSNIHQTIRKSDGRDRSFTLSDIHQSGADIEKIISQYDLNPNYCIGAKITKLRQAYKGKGSYKITLDDKRRAERIGIVEITDLEEEQASLQSKLNRAKELDKYMLESQEER